MDIILRGKEIPPELAEYFEPLQDQLKDVFVVNPKGFSGAHFATFCGNLIEPMIKAGTSEHGVCPECGAPWERVTSKGAITSSGGQFYKLNDARHPTGAGGNVAKAGGESEVMVAREHNTLGWQPSCECNAGEPIPATVLDHFGGAGTTALKARELGRDCIIIELSEEYCEMTRRRLDGTEEIETVDHNGDEVTVEQARLFSSVVME